MKHYKEVAVHKDELLSMMCDRCSKKAEIDDMVAINNFHTITAVGALS